MRQIKFRAWDDARKVMIEDFQFFKSGDLNADWIIPKHAVWEDIKGDNNIVDMSKYPHMRQQFEVMQYTGLIINEQEIYEHDVLRIVAEDENGNEIGKETCVVDFDRQAFVFAPSLKQRGLTQDALFKHYKAHYLRWKLLGNIYENPELLLRDSAIESNEQPSEAVAERW